MSKVGLSDDDLEATIDRYSAAYFGPCVENNTIFTIGIMCSYFNDTQELVHRPDNVSDEKAVKLLGKELYELIFESS